MQQQHQQVQHHRRHQQQQQQQVQHQEQQQQQVILQSVSITRSNHYPTAGSCLRICRLQQLGKRLRFAHGMIADARVRGIAPGMLARIIAHLVSIAVTAGIQAKTPWC